MPALSGMKADGFYDRHSSFQQRTMDASIGWLESAVARMPLPDEHSPFTIADYGCSEGRNSIDAVSRIARALWARRPQQPLVAIHTDLASNNFNQVLANLNDAGTENYYQQRGARRAGVSAYVSGGSFYEALLPRAAVQAGISFLAVEWMDKLPGAKRPDSLRYRGGDAGLQQEFARQADEDLTCFLGHRARELAPGGKLLVVIPGTDGPASCGDGLLDVLDDAVRDLVQAGRIARGKYDDFMLPVYYRTLAEMTAPVTRTGSPVCDALEVERAETLHLPVSFVEELNRTGDREAYAAAFTGFLRAFSEPVVVAALRTGPADTTLGEEIYDRVRARLAAEPERYPLRNIEVAVLYSRR